ncbi:MAG: transporter substrate-binding domain-containing protein [Armatimonadetes bacterium]|nr:transporter substrate-binding domain-containing protein [Armatimonadota bacterium]
MRASTYKALPVAVLFLALSACTPGREPIRIGVNAWPPCELWYVAEAQGYFAGLDVELVRFSTWTDNMSSLYSGKLDVTHASYLNALFYSDKGTAGRIILVSDTLLGGDGFVVRIGIEGDALKGKRVAVEVNTDEHFLLQRALISFGLREDDVSIVPSTSAATRDLFVEGKVDAAFTYEPYLSDAASAGGGRVVWTTRNSPGYMMDVLIATDESVRKRSADLVKLLAAWYRAQAFVRDNPDKAFATMAPLEGMSVDDFRPFYRSFTFYDAEENRRLLGSDDFLDRLREMNEFLVAHRAIAAKADMASLYTRRIVEALR